MYWRLLLQSISAPKQLSATASFFSTGRTGVAKEIP
jgi:hypothetical protein